ncbi:MAG: tartrate dehydrogenase/decarboxylase / D-malate dehydrogenase [Thermoplasmata archaeon]|jgi:3-isopropylmalate dehydrogenase|nr:tartrate dehydrogenase/decarboxylase / D-malate dehydrogenase [Thermoplasmata archaeon]
MADAKVVSTPGDGVGKEVVPAALTVLEALQEKHGFHLDVQHVDCGAQHYQKTGHEWEEGGLARCGEADAVLLGAVGWPGVSLPDGNIAGWNVIFGLRLGLDLYANVRPCRLYPGVPHKISEAFTQVWKPENVDMLIFRENTEGSYTPTRGMLTRAGVDEVAIDSRVITRKGATRINERAFEAAEARAKARGPGSKRETKVTCVDKSNVRAGCRLFRACYDEVGKAHPAVKRDYSYVDAFTQSLVRNPEWYDVVVAPNMLGDIITDLAAVLQGGMGMAGSGNIGDRHAMFEPVHGSAPKHAGQDVINPYATILTTGMMLEHLGRKKNNARMTAAAATLERAVQECLARRVFTYDLGGKHKCSQVGHEVAQAVKALP